MLPRVLHVPIAVVGDYFVMKLASHLFGREAGLYAVSLACALILIHQLHDGPLQDHSCKVSHGKTKELD